MHVLHQYWKQETQANLSNWRVVFFPRQWNSVWGWKLITSNQKITISMQLFYLSTEKFEISIVTERENCEAKPGHEPGT